MNLGIIGLPTAGKVMKRSRPESPKKSKGSTKKRQVTEEKETWNSLMEAAKRKPQTPLPSTTPMKSKAAIALDHEDLPLRDRIAAKLAKLKAKDKPIEHVKEKDRDTDNSENSEKMDIEEKVPKKEMDKDFVVNCTPVADQIDYANKNGEDSLLDGEIPATMPEKSLKRKVEVESIVPPKKKQKEEDSEATEKQEESEKRDEVLDKAPSKPEVNTEKIVSEEEANSSDEEKSLENDDEEKAMLEEKMKNLFSLLDNKIPPPGKKPGISPYIRKKVPKPKRNSFEHEELSPRKSPAKQNPFKKLKTHAENDDNHQDFSFDDESQEYINNSQVVVYVNPTEETGRKKLKEKLHNHTNSESSSSVSIQEEIQSLSKALHLNSITIASTQYFPPPKVSPKSPTPKENDTTPKSPAKKLASPRKPSQEVTPASKYFIVLSNVDQKMRSSYEDIIRKLNGVVEKDFTANTTHVVTPMITASMKCLAACASGRWLLKLSFLDQSNTERKFVAEEPHEWTAHEKEIVDRKDLQAIGNAARLCREHLEKVRLRDGKNMGLFSGFRIAYSLDKPQQEESWRQIIEAGGGTVVCNLIPLKEQELKHVTHAFFEVKRFRTFAQKEHNLVALKQRGIPCLDVAFLKQWICSAGTISLDEYDLVRKRNGSVT